MRTNHVIIIIHAGARYTSLAPLYSSSDLVLQRRDKFFCLQIGSRTEVVSEDCLKLYFLTHLSRWLCLQLVEALLFEFRILSSALLKCLISLPPRFLCILVGASVSSYLFLFLLARIRTELLELLEGSALPFLCRSF